VKVWIRQRTRVIRRVFLLNSKNIQPWAWRAR
jgi:hypothetical protein